MRERDPCVNNGAPGAAGHPVPDIEVSTRIEDFDRSEWDAVARDDVFARWAWLRTYEQTHARGSRCAYFAARRAGRLVGVAPCVWAGAGADGDEARGLDLLVYGRLAGAARQVGMNVTPALACGPPTGLGRNISVRGGDADAAAVAESLIDAMERAAREAGAALCFRNLRDEDSALGRMLRSRGYARVVELPSTVLDVRWSSFGEYVRDLKRTHRSTARNISHELNRAARAGLRFDKLDDPGPCAETLHALLDAHSRRLNGVEFPYGSSLLPALKRELGDLATVYVASLGERPVSVVVGLRAGEAMFLVMVGHDPVAGRESYVYFNNSYNAPIRDAIETGVRRVYCGKLVYDVKLRRGFRLVPLSAYVRTLRPWRDRALRRLAPLQAAVVRGRFARIAADEGRSST